VRDAAGFADWLARLGSLDILVLNVSAISPDWAASIALDIESTVRCCEQALPLLQRSQHAAITYIGSLASSFALPESKAYGAAKAAMVHFMKSLAREHAAAGLRVNTVSPGYTLAKDGFWDRMRSQAPEAYQQALQANPMGRLAEPQEIARVVAFVSSPAASFVSGANWFVDGAATLHVHG